MATQKFSVVSSDARFTFTFVFDDQKLMSISATDDQTEYDCRLELKRRDAEPDTFCCSARGGFVTCLPGSC